jgi:hypothetical protein
MITFIAALGLFAHEPKVFASPPTDNPPLEHVVERLNAHDTDGLLGLVQYTPRPCSPAAQTHTQPRPQCPPGVSADTTVLTFMTAQCSPFFTQSPEDVRRALSFTGASRVVAVVTGYFSESVELAYMVVVKHEPDIQGSLVYVTDEGRITGVATTCSSNAEDFVRSSVEQGYQVARGAALPNAGAGVTTGASIRNFKTWSIAFGGITGLAILWIGLSCTGRKRPR